MAPPTAPTPARRGWRWLSLATCAGVAIAGAFVTWQESRSYRADNPMRRGSSIFDRMHSVSDFFPVSAAEFFADNAISGNAVAAWEWEGYLHWVHPALKLFIGGRAQQVYPGDALELWFSIQYSPEGPELLRQQHAGLVVLPSAGGYSAMISRLIQTREWACIYDDSRVLVLTDTQSEAGRALALRALGGTLRYPSDVSRELSFSMGQLTGASTPDSARVLAALQQANAAAPTPEAYQVIGSLATSLGLRAEITTYLEQEAQRLEQAQPHGAGEQEIRRCRIQILATLGALYRTSGRTMDAYNADTRSSDLSAEAMRVKAAWR